MKLPRTQGKGAFSHFLIRRLFWPDRQRKGLGMTEEVKGREAAKGIVDLPG